MNTRTILPPRAGVRVALAVGASVLLVAGCGHRIPDEELLAANSRVVGETPAGPTETTGPAAEAAAPTEVPSAGAGSSPVTPGPTGTPAPASATPTATVGRSGQRPGPGPSPSPAAGGRVPAPVATQPPVPGGQKPAPVGQAGCATPNETGPILIGSVGNYSGVVASSMVPFVRPVQAWMQDINSRGGLCGREVKLIIVDDKGDPAQHRAALQDLVEERRVVAFVSNAAVLTSTSGVSYLESVKVPVLGSSCSVVAEYKSPLFFLPCPSVADQFFGAARAAALFGGESRKWGLVYCREAEVCTFGHRVLIAEGAAKEAGLEIVHQGQASIVQPDYTSECLSAQRAGADKLFVIMDLASLGRFVNSCNRQGYNPTYVQLSSSIDASTKDLPGMRLVAATGVFSFAARATPAEQQFQSVVAKYLGSTTPGPGEAQGWANAKLLEAAVTRAAQASASVLPSTLVPALNTFKGETLDGLSVPLTFPAGAPGQAQPCFWVSEGAAGRPWSVLHNGKMLCRGRD
ncbi:MAG: ABC transporter substrate-binding protein [Actinomycetota bacterium]|jgi:branched-chain amino acid transport system substrate-binding protein